MAKINVCDVCKGLENKLVESEYKRGYKGWPKMDVCEKHKNHPMGKTPQEFNSKLMDLLYGGVEAEVLIDPEMVKA